MKSRTSKWNITFLLVVQFVIFQLGNASKQQPKAKKIGKNINDFNDADVEHLLDQWEENDEDMIPLEPDELPEHLRPQQNINLEGLDFSNPDNLLKASKKGKSVMMFVDVNPKLSVSEAESVLSIWQTSLRNSHIIAERYPIEQKRAIFMFRDGAQAVDGKNYIIEQPECLEVTLDGQSYKGKHATEAKEKKPKPKAKVEKIERNKKTEF